MEAERQTPPATAPNSLCAVSSSSSPAVPEPSQLRVSPWSGFHKKPLGVRPSGGVSPSVPPAAARPATNAAADCGICEPEVREGKCHRNSPPEARSSGQCVFPAKRDERTAHTDAPRPPRLPHSCQVRQAGGGVKCQSGRHEPVAVAGEPGNAQLNDDDFPIRGLDIRIADIMVENCIGCVVPATRRPL
ncbi:MAG: LOW QUALITY PROTEIN: hypothetical protein BJ554DRAFT_952 [Olpidium bornovanus]|uniref:Uncharacterized protein n=1 Tax=Olpidium bornovanus TaxID=278681 RepID=A0A8H8DHU0_9FUNG|nr:MAG: LOW QUALITY PROTEIN: hypothetical protein BJ554DRAFT_952 [Olpidium bornovanus]